LRAIEIQAASRQDPRSFTSGLLLDQFAQPIRKNRAIFARHWISTSYVAPAARYGLIL